MTGNTVSKWLPAGLAPLELSALSWLPMMSSPVRIEENVDGKTYTLRAEMPGVDPAKDVTVTYHDGALRLQIRRADARKDKTHTEFGYGTFNRTVTMSTEVDEDSIRASYTDGILEIHAKVTDQHEAHRTIPIAIGAGASVTKKH
jgi:HSP20 family protein